MMLGASTCILDSACRTLAGDPPDENRMKSRIYGELFGSFARRLATEYGDSVIIERNRTLHETQFKFELYVFNQAQLDDYYTERSKQEAGIKVIVP